MQKLFSKFCHLHTLRGGVGVKTLRGVDLHSISKNTDRIILILAPIDSESHVSYSSIMHFDTLNSFIFRVILKKNYFIFGQESHKLAHFLFLKITRKIKELRVS